MLDMVCILDSTVGVQVMNEILLGHGDTGNDIGLGDLVDGVRFWGEVPTSEFITGDVLATEIGLTAGTAQFTNEPWLHFELDGKTLYVAKKPLRHSISWNNINAQGVVFGTRTIELNGETFKVRLLTGADTDPTSATSGSYDPAGTSDSEWNRLLYAVHNGVHTNSQNTTPPGYWPLYSDIDLVVHSTGGNGSRSWCQETNASSTGSRVYRGQRGVSYFAFNSTSRVAPDLGWRPVLELVP